MSFQTIPPEIQSAIFDSLTALQLPKYKKRHILNTMFTCKQLYSIGLPYLYHDVYLTKLPQAYSFFVAIYQFGHLVRRIRIDEHCRGELSLEEKYRVYKWHGHITARDRLLSIAKFCPNLRTFFLSWNCNLEYYNPHELYYDSEEEYLCGSHKVWTQELDSKSLVFWIQEFVKLCPTLEVFVAPRDYVNHKMFEKIYSPLTRLQELYLTECRKFSVYGLIEIARCCPKLRKVSLFSFSRVSLKAFSRFIDLLPNLDTLRLENVSFTGPKDDYDDYCRDDKDKDDKDEDDVPQFFSMLHRVGDLLLLLSARAHMLQILVLREAFLPDQLPIIPIGGFSKLRVLDIRDNYLDTPENLVDFLSSLPALEIVNIDPTNALLADGRAISEMLPQRVDVFTYLHVHRFSPPDEVPGRIGKRMDLENFIHKAWEEGRLRSGWDDYWGWRFGAIDDGLMDNWESHEYTD